MVVSLKTPNTDEAGVLSFGMMQITQGLRSDVREYIEGPGILVYGRGMRFIDNTGFPTRTTR